MAEAGASSFRLEVATPGGLALSEEVTSMEAPSVRGEFGVLPGHRPLLAALRAGRLRYHVGGQSRVAAVGPGFAEVEPDRVTVLTDAIAFPEGIDVDRVRQERAEANEKLAAYPEHYSGPDYDELERAVAWAQARLDAAGAGD